MDLGVVLAYNDANCVHICSLGVTQLNTVEDYEDNPFETQCPDVQVPGKVF